MKKWIAATLCLALVFLLVSCGNPKSGDCPATIMVNGTNYYSTGNAVPVEVDESAIQYTTSYAEDGVPKRMEKQISTETLEILMPFLKVVW